MESGAEGLPERTQVRGADDVEEMVGAEQVQLAGLREEGSAQGAWMGVATALGEAGSEAAEHVGGWPQCQV